MRRQMRVQHWQRLGSVTMPSLQLPIQCSITRVKHYKIMPQGVCSTWRRCGARSLLIINKVNVDVISAGADVHPITENDPGVLIATGRYLVSSRWLLRNALGSPAS
jgi:hypothetical protein